MHRLYNRLFIAWQVSERAAACPETSRNRKASLGATRSLGRDNKSVFP